MSGQVIQSIEKLPESLMILNLSCCKLKSLSGLSSCLNLKLLNLCRNSIRSVKELCCLNELTELYVSYNLLEDLCDCGRIKILKILDASFNPIKKLGRMQCLQYLQLNGSQLSKKEDYYDEINNYFPNLIALDTPKIETVSYYALISSFAHENITKVQAEIKTTRGELSRNVQINTSAKKINMPSQNKEKMNTLIGAVSGKNTCVVNLKK